MSRNDGRTYKNKRLRDKELKWKLMRQRVRTKLTPTWTLQARKHCSSQRKSTSTAAGRSMKREGYTSSLRLLHQLFQVSYSLCLGIDLTRTWNESSVRQRAVRVSRGHGRLHKSLKWRFVFWGLCEIAWTPQIDPSLSFRQSTRSWRMRRRRRGSAAARMDPYSVWVHIKSSAFVLAPHTWSRSSRTELAWKNVARPSLESLLWFHHFVAFFIFMTAWCTKIYNPTLAKQDFNIQHWSVCFTKLLPFLKNVRINSHSFDGFDVTCDVSLSCSQLSCCCIVATSLMLIIKQTSVATMTPERRECRWGEKYTGTSGVKRRVCHLLCFTIRKKSWLLKKVSVCLSKLIQFFGNSVNFIW